MARYRNSSRSYRQTRTPPETTMNRTKSNTRSKTLLSTWTLLAALALVASTAWALEGAANRLTFDLDGNAAGTLSADARTLTVTLPPPTAIGGSYPGRTAKMRLAFVAGSPRPQARFVEVRSSHGRVHCYLPSGYQSAPTTFSCSADPTWLRTLRSKTSVRIEVKGQGVEGSLQTSWIFEPSAASQRRP